MERNPMSGESMAPAALVERIARFRRENLHRNIAAMTAYDRRELEPVKNANDDLGDLVRQNTRLIELVERLVAERRSPDYSYFNDLNFLDAFTSFLAKYHKTLRPFFMALSKKPPKNKAPEPTPNEPAATADAVADFW